MILRLLCLVLLYTSGVFAQTVCTNKATLLNIGYDECRLSPTCMDSFYLTESEEVWERPRFDHLLLRIVNTINSNVTLICSDQAIFEEWFSVIAEWNFCRRNEVYSMVENKCTCRSGKNCDLTVNGTSGYTTRELGFLIVLVLLGNSYFYYSTFPTLAALKPQKSTAKEIPKSQSTTPTGTRPFA